MTATKNGRIENNNNHRGNSRRMFKVLGKDCLYIDIAGVFKEQILSLSSFDEKASEFSSLMTKTDVQYLLNGSTEESCFILTVPDEYTPEQIQLMADVVIRAIERFGQAPITVEGKEQRYRINISNQHEPELIGIHKTPGMSSLEIFKPIISGWSAEGRPNTHMGDY